VLAEIVGAATIDYGGAGIFGGLMTGALASPGKGGGTLVFTGGG